MPLCVLNFNPMLNFLKFIFYLFKYKASVAEWFNIVHHSKISSKSRFLGSHHISYAVIDDYTYVSLNARISYAHIGKYCSIGPNFICGWGIHPLIGISTSPMFYSTKKQNGYTVCDEDKVAERKHIEIGNDVFIGANVTVLDGVTIEDGAIIGAGTVVNKSVPAYSIVAGSPMRIIRYRFNPDVIKKMKEVKWWENGEKNHLLIETNFFDVENFLNNVK